MSAIAAMKLSRNVSPYVKVFSDDAAATNSSTFSPDGITPAGVARWVDRSGGIPAAYPLVTLSMRRPSQGNRNYKIACTVSIPKLETLGTSSQSGYLPGDKVGYTCVGRLEFVIPERATEAEREALYSAVCSVLATHVQASDGDPAEVTASPLQTAITDLETVY